MTPSNMLPEPVCGHLLALRSTGGVSTVSEHNPLIKIHPVQIPDKIRLQYIFTSEILSDRVMIKARVRIRVMNQVTATLIQCISVNDAVQCVQYQFYDILCIYFGH